MKAFLKDNIALVAAIALPALLAVIFALSTLFVSASVEDPKNDFFVATDYYDGNSNFEFNVNNNMLAIAYKPPEKDEHGNTVRNDQKPRLWRVNVPEMTVQEISLNEPAGLTSQNISIPGVTDLKVVNLTPGPDGYEFINEYRSDTNIMSEIFSGRSGYKNTVAITKMGRQIPIRIPNRDNYYSYNTRFIGWIIEDERK